MAATITKLVPRETPITLEDLIDEAGQLNARRSTLEVEYDALRAKIANLMPIPDGDEKVIEEGYEYVAENGYNAVKTVDMQKLFEYDVELFMRLVKVQVTLAEKSLPKDIFHAITSVKMADVPTLKIRRKK